MEALPEPKETGLLMLVLTTLSIEMKTILEK